ncbi:MAG TPA: dihydrolipoamide acetyltransferase family protein [Steroidobacteraceae bacterium]|nr:dihydrolipoamide acetyltransferase family protein [Steroidobacteraceae bacterium]
MKIEFRLPSLGADMESAVLTEWLKKPGDRVRQGEPLVTVETTKGLIDVESYDDGQLLEHLAQPGAKVPVGAVLARLEVEGTSRSPPAPPVPHAPPAPPAPHATPAPPAALTAELPAPAPALAAGSPEEAAAPHARISPAARRRAHELGVSLEDLERSGGGDIVHIEDVEKLAARKPAAPTDERALMRATIGAAMARAKREIPHYYLGHCVDFGPARDWLTRHNAPLPVKERLLDAVLITKAVALAAFRLEGFNGYFRSGRFEQSTAVNAGVAIAVRGGGLVAPALLDAHRKDLATLMQELSALVVRVRAGHLRSGEFTAATLTITNLGAEGVDVLYPVINPPQVAIIGAGAIRDRPWVEDGRVVVRPVLTLALAADHRVTDGRAGARFLRATADLLAQPQAL